jgi:hypothetical protein
MSKFGAAEFPFEGRLWMERSTRRRGTIGKVGPYARGFRVELFTPKRRKWLGHIDVRAFIESEQYVMLPPVS